MRGATRGWEGGERESDTSEELYTGKLSHQSEPSMSLQRDPKPRFQVHLHYAIPKHTNKMYIIRLPHKLVYFN